MSSTNGLPMQPFFMDGDVVRFRANKIVELLLEESQRRGFGLNELVARTRGEPQADWEQFEQLIGYSLAGYHELSLVSDQSAKEATEEARKQFPEAGGCRDDGCGVHCGVERR